MSSTQHAGKAQAMADRLPGGAERTIHNSELRVIFGVSRITATQRQEIVRAAQEAGLEVVSGATIQPLVVRNPAAGGTPAVANEAPWFKRKSSWAIAFVVFFVLVGTIGSIFDSADETDSQEAAATVTQPVAAEEGARSTSTTPAGPTRSDVAEMVNDDLYAEALAAAALLGNDNGTHTARMIANRLARRTMFALDRGNRSRAHFLVLKARDFPSTTLSLQASAAYDAAQDRVRARAAARRVEAQRLADAQAAREEAQRAAEATPDAPEASVPDASGPSTTNWCGKRDGDGDGIYCEGE